MKPRVIGIVVDDPVLAGTLVIAEFSVFTRVRVCATAEEGKICTTQVCILDAPEVARVIVSPEAELFVTMFRPEVTGMVAALLTAVMAFAVKTVLANVWVPVKV